MNIKNEIFSYLRIIAIGVIIAVVLNKFVVINTNVTSESMVPTLKKDDKLIGLRLAYLFGKPERGDIVVFKFPDDETQLYVKRIIGVPGDLVEIRDGRVYLNGSTEPLDEPYVNGSWHGNFGPYLVEAGNYFMLGDNRDSSADSRFWNNTYVTEKEIVAKLWFNYYMFGIKTVK